MRALERVPPRERPFAHELTYGTLRLRGRLDHVLSQFVKRGLTHVEPDVLDVLRLAAYQLTELAGVPAYAAVSQAVEQARAVGGRGAGGFVNGVLQSLRRAGGTVTFPSLADDPVGRLTTLGSHPRWIVERWVERFGAVAAEALTVANNERPALYLHPVGIAPDDAIERLVRVGIDAERPDLGGQGAGVVVPGSIRILPPAGAIDALAAIPAIVQDPAATLAALALAAPPGVLVADLCAAPGGKALVTATRSAAPALVVAADASPERIGRLRENVARVGTPNIAIVVADARRPPLRRADAVLIDAPCTGTGTFRRHPDGRWRVTPDDLRALCALQREILDAAADIVPPGGTLLYATCSLEPEENEEQVEAFLMRQPGFAREPIVAHQAVVDRAGQLVVLPHVLGVDGAFAARLRRR